MSFSTGVMLYLSFMDIIADTTSKIGEFYANVAFFLGMVIFLMLEFCLPEVEGSQMAEIFGLNLRVDLRKTPQLRDTSGSEHVEPMEPLPVAMSSGELGSSSLRRRDRHQTAPLEFAGNPQPTALKQKPTTSEHPRAPSRSPVHRPAQTAMTEAEQHQGSPVGGQSIRTKANSIAFTGMMAMVSISLHNIPEGIAVYLTCLKGVKSGLPLAIAMAFHNIPEGMAVAGPLFAATKSKKKAVLAATVSGLFEVVGCALVLLCYHQITPFLMEVMSSCTHFIIHPKCVCWWWIHASWRLSDSRFLAIVLHTCAHAPGASFVRPHYPCSLPLASHPCSLLCAPISRP